MLIQFFSDNPYVSALVAFLIGWAFMPMVVRVAKARDFVVKPLLELLPHHVLADGTPVTEESVTFGKATKL